MPRPNWPLPKVSLPLPVSFPRAGREVLCVRFEQHLPFTNILAGSCKASGILEGFGEAQAALVCATHDQILQITGLLYVDLGERLASVLPKIESPRPFIACQGHRQCRPSSLLGLSLSREPSSTGLPSSLLVLPPLPPTLLLLLRCETPHFVPGSGLVPRPIFPDALTWACAKPGTKQQLLQGWRVVHACRAGSEKLETYSSQMPPCFA